jgi:hypothetical protein
MEIVMNNPFENNEARAKAARLLGVKPEQVDALELEIINEMIECGRCVLRLHRQEMEERIQALEAGKPIEQRWNVSPGVGERVARLLLRLLQVRRQKLGLEPPPAPHRKAA